jgi:23S rRNA (uracil1939-C5)-methyltransferase
VKRAPVETGDRLELTVEHLVAGGDALCRMDGFPVFVPELFPGDLALVEILEVRKGFARGERVDLSVASPQRRATSCPVADECGGCDWTALRLDRQLDAKTRILADSLRRTGRLGPEQIPPIRVHASPLNYRLRSRLHRDERSGEIGFFARRSHRVVPLPASCEVVGMATLEGLREIREAATGGDTVDIFESDTGLRVVSRREGDTIGEEVALSAGRFRYRLATSSFFQVNRHLSTRLIDLVRALASECAEKRLAFDLYGGVGFFALPLSHDFENVVSVESSQESAPWAEVNLSEQISVKVVRQSVEQFLAETSKRPDFVLVDPPRAGLSPRVRSGLNRIGPKRIAYLSCDPVTFSRDVAELVGHGWTLRTLDLIDLFPNTHHVETLASLVIAD